MTKKKRLTIELEWKQLEKIAEYYAFPVVVFLSEDFPQFTNKRNKKMFDAFRKIRKICEDWL